MTMLYILALMSIVQSLSCDPKHGCHVASIGSAGDSHSDPVRRLSCHYIWSVCSYCCSRRRNY